MAILFVMTLVKDRLGIYEAFRALDELFWEEASTYISSFLQWEMGAEFQAALITLIFSAPGASLVTQKVNNLSAMQETQVWSLGWEDSLEKGIPTHSSILPGESPGQTRGSQRVRHNWVTDSSAPNSPGEVDTQVCQGVFQLLTWVGTWKTFLLGTQVFAVLFDPKGHMEDQREIVAFAELNLRI